MAPAERCDPQHEVPAGLQQEDEDLDLFASGRDRPGELGAAVALADASGGLAAVANAEQTEEVASLPASANSARDTAASFAAADG